MDIVKSRSSKRAEVNKAKEKMDYVCTTDARGSVQIWRRREQRTLPFV